MTVYVLYGVILFTAALVFYSVGVWHEWWSKKLRTSHVVSFCLGLLTDAGGTWMMYKLVGYWKITAHRAAGIIGL